MGEPEEKKQPFRHLGPPPGRNQPCPCGSGKKFKKCCRNKETIELPAREAVSGELTVNQPKGDVYYGKAAS